MTKKKKLLIASISIITAVSIFLLTVFAHVLFTDPIYIVVGAGLVADGILQIVGLPVVDIFTDYDVSWMKGKTNGEIREKYGEFDRVLMNYVGNPEAEAFSYDLPFGFGLSFETGKTPQITGYGSSDWISYDEYLARYTYSSN